MARGHAWQRGACVAKGGACMVYTPQDTAGHCAGSMHPTEMHSCLVLPFVQKFGKPLG